MPVQDIDIWRTANLLINQHGDEAAIHAAMKADEMLELGDVKGEHVWHRVIKAIKELVDAEPRSLH